MVPIELKPPEENWETCSLHILLARVMRLNRALLFCKGRAADVYGLVQTERDRLIEIYKHRVTTAHKDGK